MAESAIEASKSLLALAQPLLHQAQVVRQRRLLDKSHGEVEAVCARQELATAARLVDAVDNPREKRKKYSTKDLVLFEHLVLIEALREPELAQLHRLGHDRHLGENDFVRVLNVV